MAEVEINQDMLRKQLMVNQFCNQVGCSPDQATQILQAARWQLEVSFLTVAYQRATGQSLRVNFGALCNTIRAKIGFLFSPGRL